MTPTKPEAGDDSPAFDLTDAFDTEVGPLLTKLFRLCMAHGMPMVASVCYLSDGRNAVFHTGLNERDGLLPEEFDEAARIILGFNRPAVTKGQAP